MARFRGNVENRAGTAACSVNYEQREKYEKQGTG